MKKLLTALFGAALILGACGGDEPAPAPTEPPAAETPAAETPATDAAAGDFDAAAAQTAYGKGCAMCHGANLEGQGSNPTLVGTGLTKEEVLAVITEGKGSMPGGLVQGDEAENVAAWIAAQ